jgi:hypothetical protein
VPILKEKAMQRTELINDLETRTKNIVSELSKLKELSNEELNHRNSPSSWSILECLEHLNLYGDFYLPEMDNRISAAKDSANDQFISSWLGNYFALSMLPGKNGKLNKMKTFKSMNPIHKQLAISVIDRFAEQQDQLLQLLDRAKTVDLSKVKTSISISKWIKLRLGDTFRVVVYHNQRHMAQAMNVIKSLQLH